MEAAALIDGGDVTEEAGANHPRDKYSEAVALRLGPSRGAAIAGLVLVAATLAVVAATPIAPGLRVAEALLVAAGFARALRVHAFARGPGAIAALLVRRDGSLLAWDAAGRIQAGTLRDGSFVAPWLTLVRWRPEGSRRTRTVVIVPDRVDAEAFRRLRVLLRWR